MRAFTLLAACLALVLLPTLLAAESRAPFPEGIDLEYRVKRSGFTLGTMERTISGETVQGGNGHEYRVASVARPGGMARLLFSGETRESSRFRWEEDGIRPLEYRYRQRTGEDKDIRLSFHYGEAVVREAVRGREWALEAGTQDLVSAQFAVMRGVAAGEESFEFRVVDEDGPETYRYEVTGETRRETPAGTWQTVRVEQIRDKPGKRRSLFWLAPELGYLPVAVEQRKGDDRKGLLELLKAPEADFSAMEE
ncbi:Protein of unknown function [Thiohalospira halophila DSM 15071]|jgi:hypothetical protein|uniref:DUF3108 domain-containing protein n=1 Tax=Thiohalospira halophila DSM 15071 TaxID=1123397 RepID=A0A1I1Q9M8_9GAMM|nr:DUF3108 domain-containing protein [Thiohalospira halophila]SFD18775.1 Protein of unknown function [Thiohalospira halophila DSM 15071]